MSLRGLLPVIAEVPLGDGIPGGGAISAGEFSDAGDPILRVVALEIWHFFSVLHG